MTDFSLFGFGRDGLPSDVDLYLAGEGKVEEVAQEIIEGCKAKAGLDRRRWGPSAEHASLAYLLVAWHTKRKQPVPAVVVDALAYALGQVNPSTGESLLAPEVRARVGLPAALNAVSQSLWLYAAQIDGIADAAGGGRIDRDILGAVLEVSSRTIDAWRQQPKYKDCRAFVRGVPTRRPPAKDCRPPVPRFADTKLQRAWVEETYHQLLDAAWLPRS